LHGRLLHACMRGLNQRHQACSWLQHYHSCRHQAQCSAAGVWPRRCHMPSSAPQPLQTAPTKHSAPIAVNHRSLEPAICHSHIALQNFLLDAVDRRPRRAALARYAPASSTVRHERVCTPQFGGGALAQVSLDLNQPRGSGRHSHAGGRPAAEAAFHDSVMLRGGHGLPGAGAAFSQPTDTWMAVAPVRVMCAPMTTWQH
jgi:hypothetical protein